MSVYYTLLTAVGASAMSYAAAHGTPVVLTEIALGDGGGSVPSPTKDTTALVNEVYRADINSITQDPVNSSWFIVELVIPPEVGGFTIREFRIDDAAGNAIYVGNCAAETKPVLPEGMTRDSIYRLIVETSNAATINLSVDPTIAIATHDYVQGELQKLDHKQSVRVASTANIPTLSGLLTIDGVLLVEGDRVLVKNNTTASQNGIYIASPGGWLRDVDANSALKINAGMTFVIEAGTANADTVWMLLTNNPITIGTTALTFDWIAGVRVTMPLGTSDATNASTAFVQNTVGGMVTKSVTGVGATLTLTSVEAGNATIKLTGTLTTNLNVIVPAAVTRGWTVINATTGAYSLTVKPSGGAGIVTTQGNSIKVYSDGTNVTSSERDIIAEHVSAADPHAQYTTTAEAEALAADAIFAHNASSDPHPQYTSDAEVDAKIAASTTALGILYFMGQL